MITHEGIDRNFHFMVLEVLQQVDNARRILAQPSPALLRRILSSDKYIDVLKSLIEKKCISYFRHTPSLDKQSADAASALSIVTNNLERIADFCANLSAQTRHLSSPEFLGRFDLEAYFREIRAALELVNDAVARKDAGLAMRLCQCEATLNELYRDDYERIRAELRTGRDTDDLLASLYILHYLERIGDSLQNIGEAVLFAITGERLKIHEYTALEETLQGPEVHSSIRNCSIEFKWETRSGSRIGKVADAGGGTRDLEAIFKRGTTEKLLSERDNIARWQEVMPGLPPRVLECRAGESDAALLLEFLDGSTFHDLTLSAEPPVLRRATEALERTCRRAWEATLRKTPVNARYLDQLSARIAGVFRVHPEFRTASQQVGDLAVRSLEELLEQAAAIDARADAPFSVLVHGDFNTDNIIYNQRTDRIHFIDLYRSRDSDYVQDVSVFIVSNFRVPVFVPELRERLNDVILDMFRFARGFAEEHGDESFELRLALGLARSFMTSTRFELNEDFARVMHMRAMYLLEKAVHHGQKPPADFHLTIEALTY